MSSRAVSPHSIEGDRNSPDTLQGQIAGSPDLRKGLYATLPSLCAAVADFLCPGGCWGLHLAGVLRFYVMLARQVIRACLP